MKHASLAVAVAAAGLINASGASAAEGTDPIKDGQTAHAQAAAAPPTGDPIKDGQTFMAASGNDLGSPNPTRPNYSLSAKWRAYSYDRGALRLIQINDASGVVRVVLGISRNGAIVLPLGVDADHVIFSASPGGEIVYRDDTVQIEAIGGQWYIGTAAN